MARRTFTGFDTELDLALGKRTDFTSAIRTQVLNAAYYYVANVIRHRELEQIATGSLLATTDSFTLATGFWFPEMVFSTTNNQPIHPDPVGRLESVVKPAGNPSKYVIWGNQMYFDRKPTATKSIRYWYTQKPAEPASSDTSVLDALYDQLILMYAIKFGHEELRDYEQAAKMMTAINVYAGQLNVPWRRIKTDDRQRTVSVQMR